MKKDIILKFIPKMIFKDKSEALNHLKSNGKYNKDGELVLNQGIHTMNYKLITADNVAARTTTTVQINKFNN